MSIVTSQQSLSSERKEIMNIFRRIIAFVLALIVSIPATSASAAGTLTVTLASANTSPVFVGSELDIDLIFSAVGVSPNVSLATIYLSYDPDFVEPIGYPIDANAAVVSRSGFFNPNLIFSPSFDLTDPPSGCQITQCIYLLVGGTALTTKIGAVARFRFRVKAEGEVNFEVKKLDVKNVNGDDVVDITPASDVKLSVTAYSDTNGSVYTTITGNVLKKDKPSGPSECIKISATQTGSTISYPDSTDINGNFKNLYLYPNTYNLKAEYPGYLSSQKSLTIKSIGQPDDLDVGTTILRGGDVNKDNSINMIDIQMIINQHGKTAGVVGCESSNAVPYGWLDPIDINDDKIINISDLAIAIGNYGLTTTDTTWP